MSVMVDVGASLNAIGVEQQACVFAFLMSYPLTLGALLEARGRRIAGLTAAASVLGFALFTDPWMHAVLLIMLAIGVMGVFIAGVYLADHVAQRLVARGMPAPEPRAVAELPPAAPAPSRERVAIGAAVQMKT